MRTPFFILLLFSCFSSFAQTLSIQNTEGKKKKSFSDKTYFEILLGEYQTGGENCCPTTLVKGTIVDIETDEIVFQLRTFEKNYIQKDGSYILDNDKWYPKNNQLRFRKSDIASFQQSKSYKALERKGNLQGFGAIAIVTGITTAVTALFVKEHKRDLFIASAVQFGLGLTLIITNNKPRYAMKGKKKEWEFQ